MTLHAERPPTLTPGQTTQAVSPPVGCQKPRPPSPFIIITQPKRWHSFCHCTEGRRLSRPRHCSKGVQPMPKAVYRSGFYEKHVTAHGGIRTSVLSHRSQACYRQTTPTFLLLSWFGIFTGGRGIVFARILCFFLCFYVSNIWRKRLDRFAGNFQGRCGVTIGRPD